MRLVTGGKNQKYSIKVIDKINYHIFHWNSGVCVWNDKKGDTARLIKYAVVSKKPVRLILKTPPKK